MPELLLLYSLPGYELGHFTVFFLCNEQTGLDETRFCETETRPRPGFIEISRPRRDRDFYKMIFRDRDKTETRNLDREIETETRVSSYPDVSFELMS